MHMAFRSASGFILFQECWMNPIPSKLTLAFFFWGGSVETKIVVDAIFSFLLILCF